MIVKFRSGTGRDARTRILLSIDGSAQTISRLSKQNLSLVRVGRGERDAAIRHLREQDEVTAASVNPRVSATAVPNDPYYVDQWQYNAATGVAAEVAWDTTTGDATSQGPIVAVIDTAFDIQHPDLAANIWTNTGEIAGNSIDDDANGYVDDVHGANTVDDNGNPESIGGGFPDDGHGTHVAGIIGSRGNNAVGVTGSAWRTRLMPIAVLGNDGAGTGWDIAEGVQYAVDNGADIINASLGGSADSGNILDLAAYYASDNNVLFTAASGNSAQYNSDEYPAASDAPTLLSVASTEEDGSLSSFSNRGTNVDLAAPGGEILSTYDRRSGFSYAWLSGTSMATPMVAGAAALYLSQHPTATARQARRAIMQTVTKTPALLGAVVTGGRLNFTGLVQSSPVAEPTPPTLTMQLLAAGESHSCAVVSGALWCWGSNDFGQLGDGTTTDSPAAIRVPGMASGVTAVSAGEDHTCAIQSGAAKCWGRNTVGQLGNNTLVDSKSPVQVQGLTANVTAISAGRNHNCAIQSGAARCWGRNDYRQLGDKTTTDRKVPVGNSGLASNVTAIAAGGSHSCAVVQGAVKCWGRNASGQLGNGTTTNQVDIVDAGNISPDATAISAGDSHSCAIVSGTVKCWGANAFGQLGNGTRTNSSTPGPVDLFPVDAVAVSAGYFHTCIVLETAGISCWGRGASGQLGNGALADSLTPASVSGISSGASALAAGGFHACARASGKLSCWGQGANGRLGDGSTTSASTPRDVFFPEPPAVAITSPADGSVTTSAEATVSFSVTGNPAPTCSIGGQTLASPATVALSPGVNTIRVDCSNSEGTAFATIAVTRNQAPAVTIISPLDGASTAASSVDVSFTATGYPAPSCTVNGLAATSPATVALEIGGNTLTVICSNSIGSDTKAIAVTRSQAPSVSIVSPADGETTTASSAALYFSAEGQPTPTCTVKGSTVTSPATLELNPGVNTIEIECSNSAGNASAGISITRNQPPALAINSPADGAATTESSIEVAFSADGYPAPACTISGQAVTSPAAVPLVLGDNAIEVQCKNSSGTGSAAVNVRRNQLPVVTISSPPDGLETTESQIDVVFSASGYPAPTCRIGARPVTSPASVTLVNGVNTIQVECTNAAGSGSKSITVTRGSGQLPPSVSISSPADGSVTSDSSIEVFFSAGGNPVATCEVNGSLATSPASVELSMGDNAITVACENSEGTDSAAITITRSVALDPPSVTIVSPADGATTTASSVAVSFSASGHPAPVCTVGGETATSPFAASLSPGANSITVSCSNSEGSQSKSITVTRNQAPSVSITAPATGYQTTAGQISLEFSTGGYPAPSCTIDSQPVTSPASVDLQVGVNEIAVDCTNVAGSAGAVVNVTRNEAPSVAISSPADGEKTTAASIAVSFEATGHPSPTCKIGGQTVTSPATAALVLGLNTVTVSCSNSEGAQSDSVEITREQPPIAPTVAINSPGDGLRTVAARVEVLFSATGDPQPSCTVNGAAAVSPHPVDLDPGANTIIVSCTNIAGTDTKVVSVTREKPPLPAITSAPKRVAPGRTIRITTICAEACKVNLSLRIGGKRVAGLKAVNRPVGTSSVRFRLPAKVVKRIKSALRRDPKTRVLLKLTPRSADATGATVTVKISR